MHPELSEYPITIGIPVAFGDMDAFGHVNNTRYFRWFEDVRFSAFRSSGFSEHFERTGVGPILAHTSCVFRKPVTYPDTVLAGVRVTDIGEDRFTMQHRLVSRTQDAVVAEGEARIVMVDYRRGGKAPLPAHLAQSLTRGEGLSG